LAQAACSRSPPQLSIERVVCIPLSWPGGSRKPLNYLSGSLLGGASIMDIPARGRSRTRRRRLPASWILRDGEFCELVRGAWFQAVQQVEIEVAKARAKEDCDRNPSEDGLDAPSQPPCADSAGHEGPRLLDLARLPTCDVPEEVSTAVLACCGERPTILAGLPLPVFWHQVRRISKKEDPFVVLQRVLNFRAKYKWPLTICVADVSKALEHGVFQYLPPQPPLWHPLLTCALRNMDTRNCAVEEYQKLAMFMMEAAFRAIAENASGLIVVVDLRGISSSLARSVLTSITDLSRGVAMCSGSLPACISHVQLIESGSHQGFLKAILSMLLSGLSAKVLSRISRGDLKAALATVGARDLPSALGGDRDAEPEWRTWLETRCAREASSGLPAGLGAEAEAAALGS